MKKHLKSLFKISVSMVTLGTMIMFVGLLMGGAGELSREITELVHLVRVGVSTTVDRIPLLESVTNINGFTLVVDKEKVTVAVNGQYETISGDYSNYILAQACEVENLDVSILNGKCYILPSENGQFGVESKDAADFQCYVSENTLYLNAFPKSFGNKSKEAEIILYVPEDVDYNKIFLFCSGEAVEVSVPLEGTELSLSSICGDNHFNGPLRFESAVISAGMGTLALEQFASEDVKLEVSSAQTQIDNMEVGTLEASLGMGTLSVKGITDGDIILNCGMGYLEMELACEQEDYNYDISGSAESVQIGADTLAGMVMERWIDSGAEKKIVLTCAMGSVKIVFQ